VTAPQIVNIAWSKIIQHNEYHASQDILYSMIQTHHIALILLIVQSTVHYALAPQLKNA
jgi:hypothetical protein